MRKKKTMRLPNGYGTIRKLSGNRRKPYWVGVNPRIVLSEDLKTSMYQYDCLGTYETRKEAMEALVEYNKDPYDVKASSITLSEVYQKWSEKKFESISESNVQQYKSVYKLCEPIWDKAMKELRLDQLQALVDNSGKNYPIQNKLKTLLNQLYEYSMKYEYVSKNYAKYVDISNAPVERNEHAPFTRKEVDTLWKQAKDGNIYHFLPLMLIYSGLRINEMLDLKKEHVHLTEQYVDIIASKTQAGVRKVPIADKTLYMWETWYNNTDSEYVFCNKAGDKLTYPNFRARYWTGYMTDLRMDHKVHDTRHTCITFLTLAGINKTLVQKIVGHSGKLDITDRVYTHFEMEEMLEAINKI